MNRSRRGAPSRRRPSAAVMPWNDYDDYPDTYADYNDTYPDYNDASPYRDYADYTDTTQGPGDDRLNPLIQKLLILEGNLSYLLPGDADDKSSLFDALERNDQGRRVGVLPMLLNQGWQIARVFPPDQSGRVLVLVQRWQGKGRRPTAGEPGPRGRPSSSG